MTTNLRAKVLSGAKFLAVRQIVSIGINFFTLFFVVRTIGPANYGIYTAGFAIFFALNNILPLGIGTFLVCDARAEEEGDNATACALLLLLGLGGAALGMAARPWLVAWLELPRLAETLPIFFVLLPIALITSVPMAQLERRLEFQTVATVETFSQVVQCSLACVLALRHAGVWAPIVGLVAGQCSLTFVTFRAARLWPALSWQPARVAAMLRYGSGLTASIIVWQLRNLVPVLLVGRLLGAEAVGYIALTTRLLEALGFIKRITGRLAVSALSKLRNEPRRLVGAVSTGMELQALALGPLLAFFALAGPLIIHLVLDAKWIPVLQIYGFVALSFMINALGGVEIAALNVVGRNFRVALVYLVNVLLLAGFTLALAPRLGLLGYAWAEVASVGSYLLLDYFFAEAFGRPRYRHVLLCLVAFAPPLFAPQLGPLVFLGLAAALCSKALRLRLFELTRMVRGAGAPPAFATPTP